MLLAIDIGNSNIVIGGIDEEKIHFEARIATDRIKTSDQYGVEIKNMLDLFRVPVEEVEDCIISSVVPPVFNAVRTGVVKVTGIEPIVVGPGIKTGLNIQMDDPASVGSDRIVIAVAALQEYKPPIILVDMGTATTMEVVDHGNTYLGGCIIPGVRVSAEALSSRASQLPGIQLDKPKRVIGKNTVECMRSGIMYGAVHRPPVPAEDDGGKRPFAEGPVRHLQEKQEVTADHRRRRAEAGTRMGSGLILYGGANASAPSGQKTAVWKTWAKGEGRHLRNGRFWAWFGQNA